VLGLIAHDTGQPLDRVFEDSLHDRWFSADEALAYGFIDEITTSFPDILPHVARRAVGLATEAA
jgi:ATP-dependent Clp protease protease subunit